MGKWSRYKSQRKNQNRRNIYHKQPMTEEQRQRNIQALDAGLTSTMLMMSTVMKKKETPIISDFPSQLIMTPVEGPDLNFGKIECLSYEKEGKKVIHVGPIIILVDVDVPQEKLDQIIKEVKEKHNIP